MIFFDYCFYRISSAYKFFESNDNWISGNLVVSACQASIILIIINVYTEIASITINSAVVFYVVVPICVFNLFVFTKKKLQKLENRWRDENNKKIKGWLILTYVIISQVLLFITI